MCSSASRLLRTSTVVALGTTLGVLSGGFGSANAGPAFTDWSATASVWAAAGVDQTELDSCSDLRTYATEALVQDQLYCSANAGYSYGTGAVTLDTAVGASTVTLDATVSGNNQWYNIGGSWWGGSIASYDQTVTIDPGSGTTLHITGTVTSDDYNPALVQVQNSSGIVAEYSSSAASPLSFDDVVTLTPEVHTLSVSLDASPAVPDFLRSWGQVDVSLSATLAIPVGVHGLEASAWGRVKGLYR